MINAHMATVTGFKTGEFLNLGKQLIAQIKIENDDDVLDCLIINNPGEESAPMEGDRIPVISIGNFNLSIGGTDEIDPTVETGEKLLYSRDENGDISALIRFLKDGKLNINGTGDFAVRFSKLEEGFDQLKSDFNSHTQNVTVDPNTGIGSATAPIAQSTASISQAKIEEIEVSDGN